MKYYTLIFNRTDPPKVFSVGLPSAYFSSKKGTPCLNLFSFSFAFTKLFTVKTIRMILQDYLHSIYVMISWFYSELYLRRACFYSITKSKVSLQDYCSS